jgi:DNA-binding SARP family transcriptional activator/predicted ATPase
VSPALGAAVSLSGVIWCPMPRRPALRIELFGGVRLIANGQPLGAPLPARQQQLLAYLALNSGTPIPRSQVASHLWPDSTDAQALTNFRREWHHLREHVAELDAMVVTASRSLAWNPEALEAIDVVAFQRTADAGLQGSRPDLETAALLYRGDVFPDCGDEWIAPHRERLRQRAVRVFTSLIELLERERALADAIGYAQRLLQFDSLNEPIWCVLMRCHARRGERATALHVYQRCAALLQDELGVQPSAATRSTYRDILAIDQAALSSAPAPPPQTGPYPLVGREAEWSVLLEAWRAAAAGTPRLLVIRGEAGIGKSRLAEELVDWCRSQGTSAATTRCYAGDGRPAFAPIVAWLQHDVLKTALTSLDTVWLTEIARLRPELLIERPDVPVPELQAEGWQRHRFFHALSQAFDRAAPLLLVLDDLQWADADTLEWLHSFIRASVNRRCLCVGTLRSDEEYDNRALGAVLTELERLDRLISVSLGPLDQAATARLAEAVAERPLDSGAQFRTFRQTEGHPLFIVEQGRMVLMAGSDGELLSPRVQSVVAARLARLSGEARGVAEVAAAIGRDFTFDILSQVSDLEEDEVVRSLDELWRRHIVRVQDGEAWDFSHDRIREVTYSAIGPARTRLIHRRIAQALERTFLADLDSVSAAIATHLERGSQSARAIPFLERAAAVAMRVSANEEAIRCFTHALALVDRMPSGRDRDERELALRTTLSGVLTFARGYGATEVEQNLQRVVVLTSRPGRGDVPVRWLWGLWGVHFVCGDLAAARDVAERALAHSRTDPACLCEAHHAMGGTLTSLGELENARKHFGAALAAYDERSPQRSALGSDLGVFAHAFYAHALWLLGETYEALAQADAGIALARRLGHAYSETLALAYAALCHQMNRDVEQVSSCADSVLALCERYGFAYYDDWATALLGWVRGQEGRPEDGIALVERALNRLDARRALTRRPYYLSLLAELHMQAGHSDAAAAVLDSAIATALARGDRWWLPELYRQKSELQPPLERQQSLRDAQAAAHAQGSRSLALRIAGAIAER